MLKASKTKFNDPLKVIQYNIRRMNPNTRTHWWTHHPLESCPSHSLPAPHELIYDVKNWHYRNDPSRYMLDLTYETLLNNDMQLDPIDLSLKNIPQTQERRAQASEFLRTLLSSNKNLKINPELEILPLYPGEKTEKGSHVPTDADNRVLATNVAEKSRTRRLPPPPPEPRTVQSNFHVVSDPKGSIEIDKLSVKDGFHNTIINQQRASKTAISPKTSLGNVNHLGQGRSINPTLQSRPSTSHDTVNTNLDQGNFVNPATIRRPPKKRKPAGNWSDVILPPSQATMASASNDGFTAQSAASVMNSLSYYTSSDGQSPTSHTTPQQSKMKPAAPQQSKVRTTTPEVAFQSYPSLSSPATLSCALSTSQAYSRSNMSLLPYQQQVSDLMAPKTYSVSKLPATVSSDNTKTTQYLGVHQDTRPKCPNNPVKSDSTFKAEDFERACSSLTERWIKQQFASIIENPGPSRKRQMTPASTRKMIIGHSGQSASGNSNQITNLRGGQSGSEKSRETQMSRGTDWAKATALYQQAVYERSPAMNKDKPV